MGFHIFVMLFAIVCGIGLGLIISKVETKLPWRELLILKYKVLILAPILRCICRGIYKTKKRLGKLYKLRNRLQEKLF